MRIQLDESDLRDAVTDWCTNRGIEGVVASVAIDSIAGIAVVIATVNRHPEPVQSMTDVVGVGPYADVVFSPARKGLPK